jgi:glucosamine--fructose-6-phosphate aminotransferase (isomerizing)
MDARMTESHMAREIAEIPLAAAAFLNQSRSALERAAEALRAHDPLLVATVARGSSDHAATYLKYVVELELALPVASIGPSVASIYRRRLRLERAAVVGISQSGQSPDIVEMMRSASGTGALTVALTNNRDSPIAAASAHCLPLLAGREASVAATKTFAVSVLAVLALVAEWNGDKALRAAVDAAPDALARAIALDWTPLEERFALAGSAYVLGRGPGFAAALEAALKLKETSGIHAEAYSAAEVLHGPSAIVQARFPTLALTVPDAALPHVVETAKRLAAQGADVFVTGAVVPGTVQLPMIGNLHPMIAPLVTVTAFYRFVERLARRRGFDPDRPPHLRKVTETR